MHLIRSTDDVNVSEKFKIKIQSNDYLNSASLWISSKKDNARKRNAF